MPFVQGHLRREPLAVTFDSGCGHCNRQLRIEIDSELKYRVALEASGALVFVPLVNFATLRARSIIDDF